MTERYRHALVMGKFYPPHLGHHHLVRTAAQHAERTTVALCAARVETIGLAERVEWLRAVHADDDRITVVGMPCDIPVDLHSEPIWRAQVVNLMAGVRQATDEPVDALFSSEQYGDELARRIGARHVPVDPPRSAFPVSGTAVRADVAGHWDLLHPVVRAGLATRVVVVGAESTGTTTVSTLLAEHYRARGGVWARTGWVAEYGREHTLTKMAGTGSMDDLVWTDEDFRYIAARQTSDENAAAATGSPLLVCDTDAFATGIWEYRYRGVTGPIGPLPRRDVYLLTDHVGVPFVQDGIRDGEHIRAEMTGWFIDVLTAAGHSWALLTGSLEDRLALAVRITDHLLATRATFTDPFPSGGTPPA